MKNFNCILNKPYPTAECIAQSKELSDRLSVLSFGKSGELTSILQYSCQRVSLPSKYAYTADILECISITEMKHFELLNKLIHALGGECRVAVCDRSRYVYWNGSCVEYSQGIGKMIRDDIRAEKRAVSAYNNFLDRSKDQKVNAVIRRIIEDEEHHLRLLSSLSEEINFR